MCPLIIRDLVGQCSRWCVTAVILTNAVRHGWVAVKRYDYVQILPEEGQSLFWSTFNLKSTQLLVCPRWWCSWRDFAAHQVSPEMRMAAAGQAAILKSGPGDATNFQLRQRQDGDQVAICDELGQVYHKKVGRISWTLSCLAMSEIKSKSL